ncbi:unnamed protein product, partial [Laminaria digitata]
LVVDADTAVYVMFMYNSLTERAYAWYDTTVWYHIALQQHPSIMLIYCIYHTLCPTVFRYSRLPQLPSHLELRHPFRAYDLPGTLLLRAVPPRKHPVLPLPSPCRPLLSPIW